jgi:RNA polymerase sigma factor (sigma-70 family)
MSAAEQGNAVLRYLRRVHASEAGAGVTDAELLRRFAVTRDEAAFELLVWRHGAMVLRVCRGVLRDATIAEDAFQATFLALARKSAAVARLTAPVGWLYRVATHIALKVQRVNARRAAREALQKPRQATPAADIVAEAAEMAALLHEEVDRLAARYRTPIVLCYLEGKTHEEAARELGWPKGTVSGRLARARDLLKHRLVRRGVMLPAAGLAMFGEETLNAAVIGPLAASTSRAAVGYLVGHAASGVVSGAASRLANGVVHTMFVAKLRTGVLLCLAAGLVAAGGGAFRGQSVSGMTLPEPDLTPASPARVVDARSAEQPRPVDSEALARQRVQSMNNLKQIGLALHNHHSEHTRFPRNITDKQGETTLSWRVAILPYLEEVELYRQFRLDEPWDSAHNKQLLNKMPAVFRVPTQSRRATETFYQGFAGPGTMFEPDRRLRIPDVTDGTSNTIFVIEAGAPVPWTKPEDLPYHAKEPLPKIGGALPHTINALFVDGSVHRLSEEFKEQALRAAITRNGGEAYDINDIHVRSETDSHRNNSSTSRNSIEHDDLAARASHLRTENASLKRTLAAVSQEVEALRARLASHQDVARLKELENETAKLSAANAELSKALRIKLAELEKLREDLKQLPQNSEK